MCYPVRQFEWSEECTVSQGEGQPQHLVGIYPIGGRGRGEIMREGRGE